MQHQPSPSSSPLLPPLPPPPARPPTPVLPPPPAPLAGLPLLGRSAQNRLPWEEMAALTTSVRRVARLLYAVVQALEGGFDKQMHRLLQQAYPGVGELLLAAEEGAAASSHAPKGGQLPAGVPPRCGLLADGPERGAAAGPGCWLLVAASSIAVGLLGGAAMAGSRVAAWGLRSAAPSAANQPAGSWHGSNTQHAGHRVRLHSGR